MKQALLLISQPIGNKNDNSIPVLLKIRNWIPSLNPYFLKSPQVELLCCKIPLFSSLRFSSQTLALSLSLAMAKDQSNMPLNPPGAVPGSFTYFPVPFHLQPNGASSSSSSQQQPYAVSNPNPTFVPPPPSFAPLPQFHQAHQLFQRDAQTITPEALEGVKAALANGDVDHKTESRKKAVPRKAAGQSWEDPTLTEWPENDFRLFCGDLGNEVNDDVLTKSFARFPSFNMARVIRDKRTGKTKGYGFVSFSNPSDLAAAIKEMNGKYVGNRPIKLRKSNWKERTDEEALKRQKNYTQKKPKMQKKSVLHK
ncbi:hypothetical protein LUZ60_013809 [Juncus effusus]|nr:hypothetical protein LUZ60_013809 [Juncus effusus]